MKHGQRATSLHEAQKAMSRRADTCRPQRRAYLSGLHTSVACSAGGQGRFSAPFLTCLAVDSHVVHVHLPEGGASHRSEHVGPVVVAAVHAPKHQLPSAALHAAGRVEVEGEEGGGEETLGVHL